MFMHYVFKMLDEESFCTCQFCSEIYPLAHANLLKCEAADSHNFVDNTQQKIQMHMADRGLDLKRLCEYMNQEEGISWQNIHAKIVARSIITPPCMNCQKRVTVADLRQCHSHLKQPYFTKGAYVGIYPCCGQHVLKNAESAE